MAALGGGQGNRDSAISRISFLTEGRGGEVRSGRIVLSSHANRKGGRGSHKTFDKSEMVRVGVIYSQTNFRKNVPGRMIAKAGMWKK